MDALATAVHSFPPDLISSSTSCILLGEGWAVFHHGLKITSGLRVALLDAFREEETTVFLQKKYGFTDPVMASVGWKYMEALFRRKSAHHRAMLSKYIHGWLPSSAFLRKQGREAPLCPFCGTLPETSYHFLSCTEDSAVSDRTTAWNHCTTSLVDKACTCPTIVDILDQRIRPFLNLPLRTRPRGIGRPRASVHQAILRATAAQDLIGWDLCLRGFLAEEWEEAQAEYMKGREQLPGVHHPPGGPFVVQQMVTFGMCLWTKRNEKLHGVTLKEQAEVVRRQVIRKVEELYVLNPSLHPRFPAIREIPLEVRCTFTTRTLQAWLRQVAQQQTWTQKRREYEQRSQRSIRHWFRPLHPEEDTA